MRHMFTISAKITHNVRYETCECSNIKSNIERRVEVEYMLSIWRLAPLWIHLSACE